MDGGTLLEESDQAGVVPGTPNGTFHQAVGQSQSIQSNAPRPVQGLGEDEELDAAGSTQDDLDYILYIPETPPPMDPDTSEAVARIHGAENSEVDGHLAAAKHGRTKRKRMESILSGEEEPLISEGMTGYRDMEGTEVTQKPSPQRQRTDTPDSCHRTKLKPLPRGAPRLIEKKGRYTIRKGVRIRDYKVPSPDSPSCLPPPSSPEFQCRDGFDANETSLSYPQPMNLRAPAGGLDTTSSGLDHHIRRVGSEGSRPTRSPSLGIARGGHRPTRSPSLGTAREGRI